MHTNKGLAPVIHLNKGGKGVVWVIIAAIVLGGGYAAYLTRNVANNKVPTPEEESPFEEIDQSLRERRQWKIYLNPTYGFSFEYPPHFEVTDSGEVFQNPRFKVFDVFDPKAPLVSDSKEPAVLIRPSLDIVVLDELGTTTSLDSTVRLEFEFNEKEGFASSALEPIELNHVNGYGFRVREGYTSLNGYRKIVSEHAVFYTANERYIFRLLFPVGQNIFPQILSTFRFTK